MVNQYPEEIIKDFREWLETSNMVRMDTMGSQSSVSGAYTVKYGDDEFEFHQVEMPPPSGVFGANYTRYVDEKFIIQLSNQLQVHTQRGEQPQACNILDYMA